MSAECTAPSPQFGTEEQMRRSKDDIFFLTAQNEALIFLEL